ncbi:hypothetical protein ACQ86N_46965 [Puia sp. P3]|uniref:hypothetical protein n=1 Tax=Puia sp. P3 TaxID=3423952 RepID=UPI003D67CFD4
MDVPNTTRREFFGKLAGTAALVGGGAAAFPLAAHANTPDHTGVGLADAYADPDAWFKNMKGKHRIVFDCPAPKELMTFAWPKVFLLTNSGTGTPETDCNVVVVLRHEAIPYAMGDDLWAKYKFGEMFKINDVRTKAPATRNPFWKCKPDDYKIPGIGAVDIGIDNLQNSGVMFCVCDMAMTVYSAVAAMGSNQDAQAVKNEWLAGVLPGVQPMPSGVWAVGRAQEHGCTYCFAG